MSDKLKVHHTFDSKSNNFIANFERNLYSDTIKSKHNEKTKINENPVKSTIKQNLYNKSIEIMLNRVTPRLKIEYDNLNSNSQIKNDKYENLFQNYVTNKAEKSNHTLSNLNLNTEVSKSTNSYGLNLISKPSHQSGKKL